MRACREYLPGLAEEKDFSSEPFIATTQEFLKLRLLPER
jgi:hypothetical protein